MLDTNIVIDILVPGARSDRAFTLLLDARARGDVVVNAVVLAELHAGGSGHDRIASGLRALAIDVLDLPARSAARAGQAHALYRARGGTRDIILADFLIGAHAAVLEMQLITRDRGFTTYFPELTIIAPEDDLP